MPKYELIIAEKPKAAEKIAKALADGKPIKKSVNKVPYYLVTHGKRDIVVACAVGHLYGLKQKDTEKKWSFPVYEIEWRPATEVNKKSTFQKKYLTLLKKLAKDADEFTVATDYDIEGEVIGLNVIKFACKKKDANRMKFSTLMKEDIVKAYENKSKHLDWGQAKAGETRHMLDWFYGINTSRALTAAIKTAGAFKIMSTGRVQGPALKLVVDKEKEIRKFVPVPFWQIEMLCNKNKDFLSIHNLGDMYDKKVANKVMKNVKGQKKAKVVNVTHKKFNQAPPKPFDLTSLQIEAHGKIGMTPKITLQVAQELYTSGCISYPRTSSQILPPSIGYKKIITKLSKQTGYIKECAILLKKQSLSPNNGKKTDPAHPAIYPTGVLPKALNEYETKLYDLIVRRFLATFGDIAVRQTMTVKLDCNTEIFIAKGTLTVEKGWHILYGKHAKFKEEELPHLQNGDIVNVKKISMLDKETQPPRRFTESSIIKELEKRGLGTKATRASIVDTLFNRGYVDGKAIKATELGIRTIETLEKYCPKIVDEELTRFFETEMEKIREKESSPETVLDHAKKALNKIIKDFKTKDKQIGKELLQAQRDTYEQLNKLGPCTVCKKGNLGIRKGRFGNFIACSAYPKCKTTFSLPAGLIKPANTNCKECSFPMIKIIRKGKRPFNVCFNKACASKKVTAEEKKEIKKVEKTGRKCPKCGKGDLVVRKSVYGTFLACNKFPKCRYTESLVDDGKGKFKKKAVKGKVVKKKFVKRKKK
tara:strand:- start:1031 stop:3310 length:2280 start_codon:yes stop_codon:yes gene_type:complete